MFRRFEILWRYRHWCDDYTYRDEGWAKFGLDCIGGYLQELKAPNIKTHKAIRFYFTEAGWKKFSKRVLRELGYMGCLPHHVRVVTVKEDSVDVVYRDKYQVAVRPRKRRDKANKPDAPDGL